MTIYKEDTDNFNNTLTPAMRRTTTTRTAAAKILSKEQEHKRANCNQSKDWWKWRPGIDLVECWDTILPKDCPSWLNPFGNVSGKEYFDGDLTLESVNHLKRSVSFLFLHAYIFLISFQICCSPFLTFCHCLSFETQCPLVRHCGHALTLPGLRNLSPGQRFGWKLRTGLGHLILPTLPCFPSKLL